MPQTADVKGGFLGGWSAAGMRHLQTSLFSPDPGMSCRLTVELERDVPKFCGLAAAPIPSEDVDGSIDRPIS
jgi:hypothetical protein